MSRTNPRWAPAFGGHLRTLAHATDAYATAPVKRYFHVTSVHNRHSIETYGLDWMRMKDAPGIAGSGEPEQEGCFLCLDEHEVEWFLVGNNTGGSVDVWAVDCVDETELIESLEGHHYVAAPIPPERLSLIRRDIEPRPRR
jgi:hypothetical protein